MDVFLKIAGVLALGSFIQSSAGFGFGLFALPLMLLMGFPLPESVIIMVIGSAIQKVSALGVMWRDADWKGQAKFMAVGLLTLPLGILLMKQVSFMKDDAMKQVIGALILFMLGLQWKGLIKPRETVADIWGYVAGFFSGLLNGLANIGGPPLVLWILAHRWSNEKMRITPIAFSIIFVPFQILFMILTFGARLWHPLLTALILTPAVLLGSWAGLKAGAKISSQHLRIYMQILLLFIALSAILKPLI